MRFCYVCTNMDKRPLIHSAAMHWAMLYGGKLPILADAISLFL